MASTTADSPETPYKGSNMSSHGLPSNGRKESHEKSFGNPFEQDEDARDGPEEESEGSDDEGLSTHKTSTSQVFVHLTKGYIGPGCLSLPWAISQLGFVPGCLATLLLGYWTSHNCWVVVGLKRRQQQERSGHLAHKEITYPEVAGWLYGATFEKITVYCILVQQLAVCCVFMSFIGTNLRAVAPSFWGIELSRPFVTTLAAPAAMALSLIPNLKALTPFVGLGAGMLFIGFGLLLIVVALEWDHRPLEPVELQWSKIPLALCAILYSYEGINLILPLEASMARPNKFFGVFVGSMATAACTFAAVAAISVAAFGKVNTGSITAFLVAKYSDEVENVHLKWLVQLANAAVSLSVLFTYPLQLFPCFELVSEWFGSSNDAGQSGDRGDFSAVPQSSGAPSDSYEVDTDEEEPQVADYRQSLAESDGLSCPGESSPGSPKARLTLVLITYLAAIAIPNVESLISLAGALAGSSVALVIPPLLQLAWYKRSEDSGAGIVQCYILLGLGLLFMGIGTVASLQDIYRTYMGVG